MPKKKKNQQAQPQHNGVGQAWRKVSDLKPGQKIAVPDDNGGVGWDEIESIKPVGREQVYDIEVEGTHNFVGNDIVAHNTYIGAADVVARDEQGNLTKASVKDNAAGVMIELVDTGQGRYQVNGRVPVKVTEENGKVRPGDKLVLSKQLPGYAMKMTESGQSIGTALESSKAGTDKILVFVNLGYQKINIAQSANGQLTVNDSYDFNGQTLFGVKAIASLSGKWSIGEDGLIMATRIVADEVETGKLKIAGATTSTVGRERIASGQNQIRVNNDNITANSTILITFRGDYQGRHWIEDQDKGWFILKLSSPVTSETAFDYWIVDTDQEQLQDESNESGIMNNETTEEPEPSSNNPDDVLTTPPSIPPHQGEGGEGVDPPASPDGGTRDGEEDVPPAPESVVEPEPEPTPEPVQSSEPVEEEL
ncbi:MAG: hypothetical protein Q8P83_01085 [bacterium]|nr:hypothetical protein [bacterium]